MVVKIQGRDKVVLELKQQNLTIALNIILELERLYRD